MAKSKTETSSATENVSAPVQVAIVGKVVPKDCGNPKLIATLKDDQTYLALGRIFGRAERIAQRTMPTGEVYEGFAGTFMTDSFIEGVGAKRAGMCYMPGGIFDEVKAALIDEEGNYQPVRFAFEVGVEKAANPQGYSWRYTPLLPVANDDPVSMIKREVETLMISKA